MTVPAGFYTTRLIVEVEVTHQFGPEESVYCVTGLLRVPAVTSVKVLSGMSNCKVHSEPMNEMVPLTKEQLGDNHG